MDTAAAFVIDLDEKVPEIKFITRQDLEMDFKAYKTRSLDDLSDYDRKYFATEEAAEEFLDQYLAVYNSLDNKKICDNRTHPAMLYKRRYIVQTLMGIKSQTFRHYRKRWQPGQLFNLHDQTFFLTVRLVSIEQVSDQEYKYNFETI